MKTVWSLIRRVWWLVIRNTLERHPILGIICLSLAISGPLITWQNLSQQTYRPAMIPRFDELRVVDGRAVFRYDMIPGSGRGRSRADGIMISEAPDKKPLFGIQTGFLPPELKKDPASWHGKNARFWIDGRNKSVWQVAIEDQVVISYQERVPWVEAYIRRNNMWLLASALAAVFYVVLIVISFRAYRHTNEASH